MTKPRKQNYTRREMLGLTGSLLAAGTLAPQWCFAKREDAAGELGCVIGDEAAAKVGENILRDGGNAIDAAIAAAFAGGVVSPGKCGVGGYGGHAVIATAGGKKITAIDFNSAAPAAARADMFPLEANGKVKKNLNSHGWLAVGVPGTLAGLQLALERYGTRSLRQILAPTIQLCEEGVPIPPVKGIEEFFSDPHPVSIEAEQSSAPKIGKNLRLASLLKILAERNSVESFYRGDLARKIAGAFQKNGGLVTREDLAAYHARELAPLTLDWNGLTIHTAPLTSPALMLLEAMHILKTLRWDKMPETPRLHAKLEALRIAWADRFQNFGDPDQIKVPVAQLLSRAHAQVMAKKVRIALREQKPVPLKIDSTLDSGTLNITAADRHGNMIAITLTHGSSYGARVAVEEFGFVLGHGMWRFEPEPGHPNSIAPRKRCITNMCPSIVTRGGQAVLAVGGAGGTRIPNSVYEVLVNFVGLGWPMEKAMDAPRLETIGSLKLGLENGHATNAETFLKKIGYQVAQTYSAYVSAVSFDPTTKKAHGISRGGI